MNKYPYEFKKLSPEEIEKNEGLFENFIRVGPKGYLLTPEFKDMANDIYNLKLQPDDVFVSGYCRSGTTWTQEMVWLIQNDLDFIKANSIPNSERVCFLEIEAIVTPRTEQLLEEKLKTPDFYKHHEKIVRSPSELINSLASPRTIKTHLALSLLPPYLLDISKVVYIIRDPRDVMVSIFKMSKVKLVKTFNKFIDLFITDSITFTPYFEGVKEAWEKRNHPRMLFLFYEDLIRDLPSALRRVAEFLNKQLSDEDIAKLCDHLDIKNMKKNTKVNESFLNTVLMCGSSNEGNFFVGKGGVGGWRDYFDEEMAVKAEKWINDNLKGTDLKFTTS